MRWALTMGSPEEIADYADAMPWKELARGAAFGIPKLFVNALPTMRSIPHEEALVSVLELAMRDKRDEVFALYPTTTKKGPNAFVEPILTLISGGYLRAIEKYIEAGFNPRAGHGAHGRNAIQVAQNLGLDDVAAMMQACVSRNAVNAVLREADRGATERRAP